MSIVLFIAVIVALIVVHELGHFFAAKWSGMRVDEFGIGYPPRAATLATVGETTYTLNWLPFGGFVKIFGEDGGGDSPRAFSRRPRILQAVVLVAGVAMNMLFAYLLIAAALMTGTPRVLSADEIAGARDANLLIASVLPGSPAARAGLSPGDTILHAEDGHYVFEGLEPTAFTEFIARGNGNATLAFTVRHANEEEETLFLRPEKGVIASDPSRAALGIEVATVGIVPLSFFGSLTEAATLTWEATKLTAQGLWDFLYGILTLSADLSQVAGPVGIAGIVGSAGAQGIGNLLSIMAIISINLAIINLIPVPALDGGRLLFVAIESVIRRPIKASVARAVNAAGFLALILLMLIVTANDIFRIVS